MNNYPFSDYSSCVSWIETQKRFNKKTSIDHMFYFCDLLGNPQKKFKSIHVTGTNGKGSVVSYLRSILCSNGLRVGTFTSPYIVKFNERIQVNGEMITDEEVVELAKEVYDIYSLIDTTKHNYPTFFEFVTLMCFIYFSKCNLDIAVIEVGIGGLLDSTNVINPISSVITNVSYDHMNVLGNTLEEILENKMGIIKPNSSTVIGVKDNNLIELSRKKCKELNTLSYYPLLGNIEIISSDITGSTFNYENYQNIQITLPGFHQVENAIIALKTIQTLRNEFEIKDEAIYQGLLNTKWLGRLEVLANNPLIVVDGAHNIDGITRVADFIKTLKYKTKRCIFACSDDKEKDKMITYLEPFFDEIIITAFTYKRHSDANILFELSHHKNKILKENIDEIVEYVFDNPYELNIFIGSLYFVSEVRPKILKKKQC